MKSLNLLKKIVKLGLNPIQSVFVFLARTIGIIDFPVPFNSSMRKTSSRSIRHYYISGIRTYLPIATSAIQEGIMLHEKINVLDFGCGVGRQLLHFTRHYPGPCYYACDIDDTSVAFIAKNYPLVETYVNTFSPPLKYQDSFFDMIYSVSIFSHLNMEDQKVWLIELGRITKPGGLCFVTTEGYSSLKSLAASFGRNENELKEKLDHFGYIYKEYKDWEETIKNQNILRVASSLVGIERSYGNTVMSPSYIRESWVGNEFNVIDVVEGIIDHRQDMVVLRRK